MMHIGCNLVWFALRDNKLALFSGWLYGFILVIFLFLDPHLVIWDLLWFIFLFTDVLLMFICIFASYLNMFENVLVSSFILIESYFSIVELD